MPQLYAANLMDNAEPVSEVIKKEKKPATEKQLAALAKATETRKRKREEADLAKQIEADLTAARIKEEEEAKVAQESKKKLAAEKRKAARNAKKKESQPLTQTTQESSGSSSSDGSATLVDDHSSMEADPLPKKGKRKRGEDDPKGKTPVTLAEVGDHVPPAWFKRYIAGVKKEENANKKLKSSSKQLNEEAEEVAHKTWGSGLVRDRVQNEVDGHMGR